jgi:ribose transport system substrate-binding protein
MKTRKWALSLVLVFAFFLQACGGGPTPTTAPAAPTDTPPAPAATDTPAATPEPAATETPASTGMAGPPYNIPVIVKTDTSTYWKIVGEGATEAGKADPDANVSFLGADSEQNIEGQIRIVEDQITKKAAVLVIAPSNSDQLKPTFDKAKAAGIPVILIDTDADWPDKVSFIGTDNEKGGKLAGEYYAKNLQKGDKVAIIRGALGDTTHNARQKGAEDAMKAAGLNVVAIQPADSDRAKGQSVMENILTANPDLKAVFCTNDEMALGASNAAKQAGKTVMIIGFDANPDALTAVKAGDLTGSVAQFPKNIGKLGVENALKVARGQTIDKRIDTGTELVTKDNLDKFMAPSSSSSSSGAKPPYNIPVIVKTDTSTYWKIVGEGATEAGKADKDANVTFLGADSEQNIEGQIRIVEDQITKKAAVLVIAPSNSDQLKPTFDKAKAAGIPVILIDTDADWPDKVSFIGTDNEKGGKLAGDYYAKNLAKGDKVAIIRGSLGDTTHNARQKGAEDAMKAAGLNVVAIQPADSDRAKGQSVMENILTANPDLKAVFCTNDEMALGASNAAKQAGKTVMIIGFDANPDALTAVKAGDLTGSVAQFPKNIGKLGVENALKVARGETIDKRIDTGTELVTKDNVDKFMTP